MKSQLKLSDTPEADEFFRRGDEEGLHIADSLQPTVSLDESDSLADPRLLRTPAQRERRARLIRVVSLLMAFLTVGAAGAFIGTFKRHEERRASPFLLDAREAPAAEATSRFAPVTVSGLGAPPAVSRPADLEAKSSSESALTEPAAPVASAAVGAELADRGEPSASSAMSAEAAAAEPIPAESAPGGEADVEDARSPEKAVATSAVVGAATSSANAVDMHGAEPDTAVAAASATTSASKAASAEKADRNVAKPGSRIRAAGGRRPVMQVNHRRAAKSAVRAVETDTPHIPKPSAKSNGYRPPTASFADE